ncbi:MAG: TetR/AcrR family transcriptional regulator [Acholeplasma sp.]|jgi:AcrR family transcriptional regulator|nr:MAG: TetR/AcrR family transcriptional regulator [Acholeplasma sp.]
MANLSLKEQKHELIKSTILNAAEKYFVSGGIDAVNLRKIAQDIGYSATNIYKYFQDKDAIIQALIEKRMQEIAQNITSIKPDQNSIKDIIALGFKLHIHKVLEYREHYKTVMLSKEKVFLDATSMLEPTTLNRLPAQRRLLETLKIGIDKGELRELDPIKTAQVLWSGMFGILIRVIIEDYKDLAYIDQLVDTYVDHMFLGINANKKA